MFGSSVLVLTALWHLLATWHFAFTPARTLGRATRERPISPIATELFRFLGAMNFAFVVLPLLALTLGGEARFLAFVTLAVANASQAVIDVRVKRMGLAQGPMFFQIFVGDIVFTAANAAACMALVLERHV